MHKIDCRSTDKMNKKLINKSEDYQHFGLRKLSVGVASVLLGTTFMIYGGHTVQADSTFSQETLNQTEKVDHADSTENNSEKVENEAKSQSQIDEKKSQTVLQHKDDEAEPDIRMGQPAGNISEKNNINENKNVDPKKLANNSDISTMDMNNVNQDKSSVSNDEIEKIFKLDKPDLSDEQLAALGLKHGEYKLDGVIYHAKGVALVTDRTGKKYTIDDLKVLHNADGSAHNADHDLDFVRAAVVDKLKNAHFTIKYIPALTGSTVYLNKGDSLSSDNAKRGVKDDPSTDLRNAVSYNWDKTNKDFVVDTNNVGTYAGMIDVAYQIGKNKPLTRVAVGVEVTIVDLKGQPIVTHINADTPDPAAGITGQPAGTTDIHWTQVPSTKTPGSTQGVVEVTYPDGTKGTTTVPVIVLAPNVPKIIYVPKTDPAPDPSTVVTNNPEIQKGQPGTTYTWERTPDPSKGGHIPTVVITHWPDGKTTDSKTTIVVTEKINENHEVVRTIVENIPNQDPKTIKQSVTFTRTNTVDSADHSKIIKAGTWKADGPAAWGVFTPDQVKGYTADPAQVPAMAVTPDTPNTKVVINYKANNPGTPDTPVTPPVDPGDNPATPVTPPVKPEQKPTTPTSNTNDDTPAPTPHATKTPAKDNGGKKTRTKNSGLDNSEKGKTNNGYVTVRPLATAMPVSPAMKKTVASEQKSTLPQTGKKDNVALTAIGVAIAAAGSLLGLADSKKHRS